MNRRDIEYENRLHEWAEDAYWLWLKHNNPDSIKYKYPNNPNDHEKFMFIQGYLTAQGYRS